MYTDLAGACPEQGRMGGDGKREMRGIGRQKSPLKMNGLLWEMFDA